MAFQRFWFYDSLTSSADADPIVAVTFKAYWSFTAPVPPSTDATPVGPFCNGLFSITLLKSTWNILLPAWQGTGDPQAALLAAQANEQAGANGAAANAEMSKFFVLSLVTTTSLKNTSGCWTAIANA